MKAKDKSHPLVRYRDLHELSVTELAEKLGVSKATVSRWEYGRLPEQKLWSVIRRKTGVRAEELARFAAEVVL